MSSIPGLLVSCTRCHLLHAPLREDAANPLCPRCVLPIRATAGRRRIHTVRGRNGARTR